MLIPLRIELLVLFQIFDVVTRCRPGRECVALVFGALVVLENNKKLVHGDSVGGGVLLVVCTSEQNIAPVCRYRQVIGGGADWIPHPRHPPRPSQPYLSAPVTPLFTLSRALTAQPRPLPLTAPYRATLPRSPVTADQQSVVAWDLAS